MTTIAYRDGVMAADTQVNRGDIIAGSMVKAYRRDDGSLIGVCGSMSRARAYADWFLAGEDADTRPKVTEGHVIAIVARSNGAVESHDDDGFHVLTGPYFAEGSGMAFALGAMSAGADAISAVRAAQSHDHGTGGDITVLTHRG